MKTMKWSKPHYENNRFGFEVTMYIGITTAKSKNKKQLSSLKLISCALLMASGAAFADIDSQGNKFGEWKLGGFDNHNTSNSSKVSRLNQHNVNDLQLKWIYNIPQVPLTAAVPCNTGITTLPCPIPFGANPVNQPRPAFGASGGGVAVDRKGRVYFATYDGHLNVLDSRTTRSTPNADGTASPNLLMSLDLFSDPKFVIPGQLPEENVYIDRMFPTLIGGNVYVGNYSFYNSLTADGSGNYNTIAAHYSNPTDPSYRSAGAVLYQINRRTGQLNWKTQLDNNLSAGVPLTGITPIYGTPKGDMMIVPFQVSNPSGTLGLFQVTPGVTTAATDPFGGECCNSRGGLAAVRISDGKIMWKTYSIPQQNFPNTLTALQNGSINAWTGGNTWGGGNLPYSKKLNMVFAGTSEGYSAPNSASTCENNRLLAGGAITDPSCLHYGQSGALPNATFNDNVVEATTPYVVNSPTLPLIDSIYAVDANTGKIKWAHPVGGFDVWNLSCLEPFAAAFGINIYNQPYFCTSDLQGQFAPLSFVNKDLDAAAPPVLIENVTMADGTIHDVIIGADKGAAIYAFDAATGAPLWNPSPNNLVSADHGAHFGAGGLGSGTFVWGLASDGVRVYGSSGASSNVSLHDFNTALSGGGNPKHIVLNSCIPSGFYPNPNSTCTTDDCKIWGGDGIPGAPFSTVGGAGGMYVAVNLSDGSIAWQRCALGLVGPPGALNRTLTTTTPVADCISGKAAVTSPGDTCVPRTANAAPTLANGVLIVSGANNYNDGGSPVTNQPPFPEVLLLNAANGKLLRELPLGVLGKPAANDVYYNRSISVGRNLFISTGSKQVSAFSNGIDPTAPYYRVLMYNLSSDQDGYCDD